MTVTVIGRFTGADPAAFMKAVQSEQDELVRLRDAAQSQGAISHRFIAGPDSVCFMDEWPTIKAFEEYYSQFQGNIRSVAQKAGVQSDPQVEYLNNLETPDEIGHPH